MLLIVTLLVLIVQRASLLQLGETYNVTVQQGLPATLKYTVDTKNHSIQTIKVTVTSPNATVANPVLVYVNQLRGVTSWQIPFVDKDIAYYEVGHTLCPRLNNESADSFNVTMAISSFSASPVEAFVEAYAVENFVLELNEPITVGVTSSSPVYYAFHFTSDVERVLIKVRSSEDTEDICAVASMQIASCPSDGVNSQLFSTDGAFQSMRSLAAITTDRTDSRYFYLVIAVFESSSDCRVSDSRGGLADTSLTDSNRFLSGELNQTVRSHGPVKNVTIVIEEALSGKDYWVPVIVPLLFFLGVFYGGAFLVDVLIVDFWLHDNHWINKLIKTKHDATDNGDFATDNGDLESGSSIRASKRNLSFFFKVLNGTYLTDIMSKEGLNEQPSPTSQFHTRSLKRADRVALASSPGYRQFRKTSDSEVFNETPTELSLTRSLPAGYRFRKGSANSSVTGGNATTPEHKLTSSIARVSSPLGTTSMTAPSQISESTEENFFKQSSIESGRDIKMFREAAQGLNQIQGKSKSPPAGTEFEMQPCTPKCPPVSATPYPASAQGLTESVEEQVSKEAVSGLQNISNGNEEFSFELQSLSPGKSQTAAAAPPSDQALTESGRLEQHKKTTKELERGDELRSQTVSSRAHTSVTTGASAAVSPSDQALTEGSRVQLHQESTEALQTRVNSIEMISRGSQTVSLHTTITAGNTNVTTAATSAAATGLTGNTITPNVVAATNANTNTTINTSATSTVTATNAITIGTVTTNSTTAATTVPTATNAITPSSTTAAATVNPSFELLTESCRQKNFKTAAKELKTIPESSKENLFELQLATINQLYPTSPSIVSCQIGIPPAEPTTVVPYADDMVHENIGVIRQKRPNDEWIVTMLDEVDICEGAEEQIRYRRYCWHLFTIAVFYALPAFQLILTYQQLLNTTGNQDICYYNYLCSHKLDVISAFNNVWSNIGYVALGFLFILMAGRRQIKYRAIEEYNLTLVDPSRRKGVPQHFGIYYTIGIALVAEGCMSAFYHVCPNDTNFQFDTAFMFIIAGLGIYQIFHNRHPEFTANAHILYLSFGLLIFFAFYGTLFPSDAFWIVMFVLHLVWTVFVSFQFYYNGVIKFDVRLDRRCCNLNVAYGLLSNQCHPQHPHSIMKLVYVMILNIVNLGLSIYGLVSYFTSTTNFNSFVLMVLLVNLTLYLGYYVTAKCIQQENNCHRQHPPPKLFLYLFIAVVCWIFAVLYFIEVESDWTVSPARSRDGNADCQLMGFFNSHDIWHFLSAIALFFSLLMLMSLDDNQEGVCRKDIRVF